MSAKKKTLEQFEQQHGALRLREIEEQLAVERAKVDQLAADNEQGVSIKCEGESIRFALTGDRHFGSLYSHTPAMHAFYEYIESIGVPAVYDVGDIADGHKVYKGQEFELRDVGFDAQVARIASDSPRNVPTFFITGNHDASFKNLAGVKIGDVIAERTGYTFLGEEQATVTFNTDAGDFKLMLMHPGGGSAYALSYKPQKIVESLEGGTKPDMLAIGHFHKAELMPSYRNVITVQTGTFQRQTPFMKRNGLQAHVGGWVFEIQIGDGFKVVQQQFVPFYV